MPALILFKVSDRYRIHPKSRVLPMWHSKCRHDCCKVRTIQMLLTIIRGPSIFRLLSHCQTDTNRWMLEHWHLVPTQSWVDWTPRKYDLKKRQKHHLENSCLEELVSPLSESCHSWCMCFSGMSDAKSTIGVSKQEQRISSVSWWLRLSTL